MAGAALIICSATAATTVFMGRGERQDVGGAGSYTFVFNTRPNKKTNLDRIADYSVKNDSIALDDAVFKKIGKGSETKPGKLSKNYFTLGDHAKDFERSRVLQRQDRHPVLRFQTAREAPRRSRSRC